MKKFLFYYMVIRTLLRVIGLAGAFGLGELDIPLYTIIAGGVVIVMGLVLVVLRIMKKLSMRMITVFYIVELAAVAFNFIYIGLFGVATVEVMETMFLGSVFDMIMSALFIVLSLRRKTYIEIKSE